MGVLGEVEGVIGAAQGAFEVQHHTSVARWVTYQFAFNALQAQSGVAFTSRRKAGL